MRALLSSLSFVTFIFFRFFTVSLPRHEPVDDQRRAATDVMEKFYQKGEKTADLSLAETESEKVIVLFVDITYYQYKDACIKLHETVASPI